MLTGYVIFMVYTLIHNNFILKNSIENQLLLLLLHFLVVSGLLLHFSKIFSLITTDLGLGGSSGALYFCRV